MGLNQVRGSLFRGGTSKGAYFRLDDLPDNSIWDEMLLEIFGSPDPSQVDGIGGSHSTASKVMIISVSDDPEVDLEYRFAQVAVEQPVVDWGGNCGNMTFGVGPFALEAGLTTGNGEETTFVMKNVNTGTLVEQTIPLEGDGSPTYAGDFEVHGLPRTGARIRSRFIDPAGSQTGELFPTGKRTEMIDVDGVGAIDVSILDVSNPVVFVRAESVGATGAELPHEVEANEELLDVLERIRSHVCATLGIVSDQSDATAESPGLPKIAFVGDRRSYTTSTGETVDEADIDILARIMSVQKPHHAYAVTGGMCTAAAALLDGTIPNEYAAPDVNGQVSLAHPKGVMEIGVGIGDDRVKYAQVDRTARKLMDGTLYYYPR